MDIVPLLEELGIEGIRAGDREIAARCPMHEQRTGRPDTHPSWSINRETGLHNCFSCGYKGGLNSLYADLGQAQPDDLDLLIKIESNKAKAVTRHESRLAPGVLNEWTEQWLRVLEPVPTRMAAVRKLNPESLRVYGVLWDKKQRCWVLPIRDEHGLLQGVQLRQKGVELNQPTGVEKSNHLFGLSVLSTMNYQTATLVESPLDAVRLFGVGIPAVSSYGAWVSSKQVDLLASYFMVVVLALDNDKAGRQATTRVERMLRRRRVFVAHFDYRGLGAKDPGDIEDDEELRAAWERSFTPLGHINRTRLT